MTHLLKIWPEYFDRVLNEQKTFEVRRADRDFQVGDCLLLQRWDPETEEYTGEEILVDVSYIMHSGGRFGAISPEYCILGINRRE